MNKLTVMALLAVSGMIACQQPAKTETAAKSEENGSSCMTFSSCDIAFGGIKFTESLNGGASCVSLKDGVLMFDAPESTDLFNDPAGTVSNTVPAIFTEVDNTRPFTFRARVKPGFAREATYNAADLLVLVNDTLYQKLCFEQDERGAHRVVSVRTVGTSDDNNHDIITAESVFLKISSDTRTIGSYYSLDGEEWHMVRLYKNSYPARLLVGIASQAPKKGRCLSCFSEMTLDSDPVTDFRMGI